MEVVGVGEGVGGGVGVGGESGWREWEWVKEWAERVGGERGWRERSDEHTTELEAADTSTHADY